VADATELWGTCTAAIRAEVSEVVGQIPWEVLSRLGRRPPRLYP